LRTTDKRVNYTKTRIGYLLTAGGFIISITNLFRSYILHTQSSTPVSSVLIGLVLTIISLISIFYKKGTYLQAFVLLVVASYAIVNSPGDFFAVGFYLLFGLLSLQYGFLQRFFYVKVALLVIYFSLLQLYSGIHSGDGNNAFFTMIISMVYILVFLAIVGILFKDSIHIYTRAYLTNVKNSEQNNKGRLIKKYKEKQIEYNKEYKLILDEIKTRQIQESQLVRKEVRNAIYDRIVQNLCAGMMSIEKSSCQEEPNIVFVKNTLKDSIDIIREISFDLIPDEIENISLMAGIDELITSLKYRYGVNILWSGNRVPDLSTKSKNYLYYFLIKYILTTIMSNITSDLNIIYNESESFLSIYIQKQEKDWDQKISIINDELKFLEDLYSLNYSDTTLIIKIENLSRICSLL